MLLTSSSGTLRSDMSAVADEFPRVAETIKFPRVGSIEKTVELAPATGYYSSGDLLGTSMAERDHLYHLLLTTTGCWARAMRRSRNPPRAPGQRSPRTGAASRRLTSRPKSTRIPHSWGREPLTHRFPRRVLSGPPLHSTSGAEASRSLLASTRPSAPKTLRNGRSRTSETGPASSTSIQGNWLRVFADS